MKSFKHWVMIGLAAGCLAVAGCGSQTVTTPAAPGAQGATGATGASGSWSRVGGAMQADLAVDGLVARLMFNGTITTGANAQLSFGAIRSQADDRPLTDVVVASATINMEAHDMGNNALTVIPMENPKGIIGLTGTFSMAGRWIVTVTFTQGGGTHIARFLLDVH